MNHLEEAKRLLKEKDYEKALAEIKIAIQEEPEEFNNWLTNFEILKELAKESSDKEKKKNYLDEAVKSIDKVIELDGEKANYYDRKSWIYDDNKDYESAIKCSTRAIELDSSNPNYYNNKADHYYNSNDYKSAIIDYTKAIELDKNNFIHYKFRAFCYFYLKDYSNAIIDYSTCIELEPKEAYFYYWRAEAKEEVNDYKGATEDYNKAIELNDKFVKAFNKRGLLKQIKLNDLDGAMKDFDKALSIDSNNSNAKENKAKLTYQMKSTFSPLFLFIGLGALALFIVRPIISINNGALLFTLLLVASAVHFLNAKMLYNSKGSENKGKKAIIFTLQYGLLLLWLLNWVLRFDVWRSENYNKALGEVSSNSSFQKDIHEAQKEHMIIFDQIVARNIGEKVLGSETTLGSQATLGTFALQNVNGKFYWVAPLIHSGFFKYMSNSDAGTPGYVKVSANDDQDVELVTKLDGKPLKIVYQPGSFFLKDIYNHLYFKGYFDYKIDQPEFEIDDKGTPFWVIPISKKHFGSKILNVDKLLIVNPETGEITEHEPNNVPKWVDRVYTPEILEDQVDWWGEYVHGYWNFAHKDIMVPSGEMVMVYGEEGHCMWYQGMTSKGLDNATVGFLLIDSKSKKVNFYKRVGATETSAMQSAEGKVQEKGYYAGHPTAYNISGEPTYLVPLHDKSDLVKAIALVNIHDYNHLVVGSNLDEALRDYEILMSGENNSRKDGKKDTRVKIKSKVVRVNNLIRAGVSTYAILLDGNPKVALFGDPLQLNELMFVYPNDSVSVEYFPVSGQNFGNIIKIENLSIK